MPRNVAWTPARRYLDAGNVHDQRGRSSAPQIGPEHAMMADPVALEAAWRWIDLNAPQLEAEEVELAAAAGRVPASAPLARADLPGTACALADGYAVRAEDTIGAGPYNPLVCQVAEPRGRPLPAGTVVRVEAGRPLPPGTDAVLPDDAVEPEGDARIGVLTPVIEGDDVMLAGSELRAGEPLWPVEQRRPPLRPATIGLLSAAGVRRVSVVRRPPTRILVAAVANALVPMLQALVERDGGTVSRVEQFDRRPTSATDLIAGGEVVLVAGGHADGLELEIRGVAIEPGRDICLGRVNGAIVMLLPGLPAACFWAYELVAGRAVRSWAGRAPGLPYGSRRLRTTHKIVSPLGFSEVVPVRLDPEDDAAILPLPRGRAPRLRTAAVADGFTLIPATSEGCAAGSVITVWLFEPGAVRDSGRG